MKAAHDHCWHDTGLYLTSMPPQYEQRCCWCGEKRQISRTDFPQPAGHGPYLSIAER